MTESRLGPSYLERQFGLCGQLALVTGSSRGLGFAMAKALGLAGAEVLINSRTPSGSEAGAQTLTGLGVKAIPLAFDCNDEASIRLALAPYLNRISIVVNNVGMVERKPFLDFNDAEWDAAMSNVSGPMKLLRVLLPHLKARDAVQGSRAKIINTVSIAARFGRPNIAPYATSKGALESLTRALATELAPDLIQVNAIAPGFYQTELNHKINHDPAFNAWLVDRTPAARWGECDEIAGAALLLASKHNNYMTGHTLVVDGGFSISY